MGEAEQAELKQTIEELEAMEAVYLAPATEQRRRENAQLEAEMKRIQEQNRQLEELVKQKADFLIRVQAALAELKTERDHLRRRRAEVLGEALPDAEDIEVRG